jgi:hypothetical protein
MPTQRRRRRPSSPHLFRQVPYEYGQQAGRRRRALDANSHKSKGLRPATKADRSTGIGTQQGAPPRPASAAQPRHSIAGHLVGRAARFAVRLAVEYFLVREVREREGAEEQQRSSSRARSSSPRQIDRTQQRCCTCSDTKRGRQYNDHPALETALSSLSRQLEESSRKLRSLAHAPATHQNCEVRTALLQEDRRIQRSIEHCQRDMERFRQMARGQPAIEAGERGKRNPRPRHEGGKHAKRSVRFAGSHSNNDKGSIGST